MCSDEGFNKSEPCFNETGFYVWLFDCSVLKENVWLWMMCMLCSELCELLDLMVFCMSCVCCGCVGGNCIVYVVFWVVRCVWVVYVVGVWEVSLVTAAGCSAGTGYLGYLALSLHRRISRGSHGGPRIWHRFHNARRTPLLGPFPWWNCLAFKYSK